MIHQISLVCIDPCYPTEILSIYIDSKFSKNEIRTMFMQSNILKFHQKHLIIVDTTIFMNYINHKREYCQ